MVDVVKFTAPALTRHVRAFALGERKDDGSKAEWNGERGRKRRKRWKTKGKNARLHRQ